MTSYARAPRSPARIAHCPALMMSSAGRPSRRACRCAHQSPTTIAVAMRMPYQRTGNGPKPKISGIWNAMKPGEANMTDYDKPRGAVSPRNPRAIEMVGAAGLEPARPFGQKILSLRRLPVTPRPRRMQSYAKLSFQVATILPTGMSFANSRLYGSDHSDLRSSPDEYGGPLLHRARVRPAARRGRPLGRLARVRSVRRLGGQPPPPPDHPAEPPRSRIPAQQAHRRPSPGRA